MSLMLRIFILLSGLAMITAVMIDLRKRKLSEKQSLFWIITSVVLMLASVMPVNVLQFAANLFSVSYIPSLIFMLMLILVVFGVYFLFRAICQHEMKVNELAQQITLLKDQLQEMQQVRDSQGERDL